MADALKYDGVLGEPLVILVEEQASWGSVTVQLWRRRSGAMRELFSERRWRSPRRRGRTMWGVVTFPVPTWRPSWSSAPRLARSPSLNQQLNRALNSTSQDDNPTGN